MDEAFIYLIKVYIALVVFYLFYRLLFSQDTFFVMRRFCLWIILGASFIYPLVTFSFEEEQKIAIQQAVVQYAPNLLPELSVFPEGHLASVGIWDVLRFCYWGIERFYSVGLLFKWCQSFSWSIKEKGHIVVLFR